MRLGLTTEGAETPVRAARKEACERIRFAQLGRNSPTLDGRQMICGRGVDEWHEVRLPPSSFRAPRSGFPRFQWLDLSTPPVSSAPLRQTEASTTRPSRHKWTLHFLPMKMSLILAAAVTLAVLSGPAAGSAVPQSTLAASGCYVFLAVTGRPTDAELAARVALLAQGGADGHRLDRAFDRRGNAARVPTTAPARPDSGCRPKSRRRRNDPGRSDPCRVRGNGCSSARCCGGT